VKLLLLSGYYNFTTTYIASFLIFSTGGNVLVNVGPTDYGMIPPIYEERLRQMVHG
jgi:hypothetical protein